MKQSHAIESEPMKCEKQKQTNQRLSFAPFRRRSANWRRVPPLGCQGSGNMYVVKERQQQETLMF